MIKALQQKDINLIYDENVTQKTLQDYYDFFTTEEGADILPYVYMESSGLYDDLVTKSEDYYLFRDEVSLIKNHREKLTQYLEPIKDIIEIGPGSIHAIQNKTLPILSYVSNLEKYYALDHSTNYLIEACDFIRSHTQNIEINTIEADLLSPKAIEVNNSFLGNKAVILFGNTLGNFTAQEQNLSLQKIYNFLNPGDIFIVMVDSNQNIDQIVKAYDNVFMYNFFSASLRYFSRINQHFKDYVDCFDPISKWNEDLHSIDFCFISKKDLSFYYPGYNMININKGQKLKGIKARKTKKEQMINILQDLGFIIQDILNDTQRMQMFICKR